MKTSFFKVILPAALAGFFISPGLNAQTTWTQTSGSSYNWSDPANWSPAIVPNSNAVSVNLTADISQDLAVTLDQAITVKVLTIGDPSPDPKNNFSIIQGGVFTLNLSANAGTPTIAQNFGNNTIAVPVAFTGASGTINNNASGTTLLFSDSVTATGFLNKGGVGDVVMGGSEGTLKNGINNAIGTSGELTVKSVYDLNGFHQTVSALNDGNTTTGVIQNSTGTSAFATMAPPPLPVVAVPKTSTWVMCFLALGATVLLARRKTNRQPL